MNEDEVTGGVTVISSRDSCFYSVLIEPNKAHAKAIISLRVIY